MNLQYEHMPDHPLVARELPAWLLSHGVSLVSTLDVSLLLDVPENQVRQRLAPLKARGEIVSAGRGLWVPVPAERREWGAPEPIAYIDALMGELETDYFVGWLSSAAFHGASHQAPQVFQVASSRHVGDRSIGRSSLRFYERDYVGLAPAHALSLPAGRAQIASVETSMLMLTADLYQAGGIDNAATAVVELAACEAFSVEALIAAAPFFPCSSVRRVGWILERFGDVHDIDALAAYCSTLETTPSYLSPQQGRSGFFATRWCLVVNREVEPDL